MKNKFKNNRKNKMNYNNYKINQRLKKMKK